MIFERKKTKVWNMFYESYNKLQKCGKEAVALLITFYDFTMQNINNNIINTFEIEFKRKLSIEAKNIIYQFVFNCINIEGNNKLIVKTPTEKRNFLVFDENLIKNCFLKLLTGASINKDIQYIDDINNVKLNTPLEIIYDISPDINFNQMLTIIFSMYGMEYNINSQKDFEKTFFEYTRYTNSLWHGMMVSYMRQQESNILIERSEKIIKKSTDGVLFCIYSFLMIILLKTADN